MAITSPEHQKRHISEYFLGQMRGTPEVTISHLEKVATQTVLGTKHDIWDVHSSEGRWWVITELTNLYSQDQYPSMDETLSFHVGLMLRMMSREDNMPSVGTEEVRRLSGTWRRFEQSADALDAAEEAEDFQAVGMRLRETLLTFISEATSEDMVSQGTEAPKAADFIHWSELLAKHICPGQSKAKLRSYVGSTLAELWRYVNWLTHARNATQFDAELARDMVNDDIGLVAKILIRSEKRVQGRCPQCGSYKLYSDYRRELLEAGEEHVSVTICEACDWKEDVSKAENPSSSKSEYESD
jgi:hypothetical protein